MLVIPCNALSQSQAHFLLLELPHALVCTIEFIYLSEDREAFLLDVILPTHITFRH